MKTFHLILSIFPWVSLIGSQQQPCGGNNDCVTPWYECHSGKCKLVFDQTRKCDSDWDCPPRTHCKPLSPLPNPCVRKPIWPPSKRGLSSLARRPVPPPPNPWGDWDWCSWRGQRSGLQPWPEKYCKVFIEWERWTPHPPRAKQQRKRSIQIPRNENDDY